MPGQNCAHSIHRFLGAVEARDLDAVAACFDDSSSYRNVPHPPAVGRAAIRALFAPILTRAERVRWDVVSSCYEGQRAFLERVDRFWIDGAEYAIECNGVYEVHPGTGTISEVRDYVDLGVWRQRLAPAAIGA